VVDSSLPLGKNQGARSNTMLNKEKLASYIDHTLLASDATKEQLSKLCKEAITYKFASVCVNSSRVKYCASLLKESAVKVCSVVGFPLGAMESSAKAFETKQALLDGASEIDMVINIGLLKEREDALVIEDIRGVKNECKDKILKVIIETCLLSEEEKIRACKLAVEGGADFVKTSTGFSKSGATVEDVELMKKSVPSHIKVKAAGGVRTFDDAQKMIASGADRIGTSGGVAIIEGAVFDGSY
jgi:deoxyribose-phosphate aldolase